MYLFSDIVNGSVQNIDLIWVVVNLMKQNRLVRRYLNRFCHTEKISYLQCLRNKFSINEDRVVLFLDI